MSKKKLETSVQNIEMEEKIAALEKTLLNSELRATALETIIDDAEKELKINIRKKVLYQTIFKMKENNQKLRLSKICWLFGISRQAYYQ